MQVFSITVQAFNYSDSDEKPETSVSDDIAKIGDDIVKIVPKIVSNLKNTSLAKTEEKQQEKQQNKDLETINASDVQSDDPGPKKAPADSTIVETSAENDDEDLSSTDVEKSGDIVVAPKNLTENSEEEELRPDADESDKQNNSASNFTLTSSLLLVALSFLHSFV